MMMTAIIARNKSSNVHPGKVSSGWAETEIHVRYAAYAPTTADWKMPICGAVTSV